MTFCTKCGNEVMDEAVVCPNCGCAVANVKKANSGSESGLKTAAKVFMVLGTVIGAAGLIPLAWCIPMTVSYFRKVNNHEPISTGFKVCSLIFVSLVGGILMLCDNDD